MVAGLLVLLASAVSVSWFGCRTTPVTGRKQLLILPESQEIQLGIQAYENVVSKETPSQDEQLAAMVKRVGQRIANVAGRPNYEWEFRLIDSPAQNAFALPGGKVAIYEGILPVCKNEAGLAVVMSHEIAHALARHGGERMSQEALTGGIEQAIGVATENQQERDRELILTVYGAASTYGVLLPYSRQHESEADHIGMMLMARAGYDPREAPRFWERFANSQRGDKPPEFLSTHPADERRASDLRNLLTEAMAQYQATQVKHGIGETIGVQTSRAAEDGGLPISTGADDSKDEYEMPVVR
jgi:predicted Zn-dependent protease